MPSAKLAVITSLAAVALVGCGAVHVKPVASPGSTTPASRGQVDDPLTHQPDRVACMRQDGLAVQEIGTTGLQIGPAGTGPTVTFTPTPGAAQADQIEGRAPGAEVIGAALLYPRQASDGELKAVEDCLARNVTG
jgi:hypothetical protein